MLIQNYVKTRHVNPFRLHVIEVHINLYSCLHLPLLVPITNLQWLVYITHTHPIQRTLGVLQLPHSDIGHVGL